MTVTEWNEIKRRADQAALLTIRESAKLCGRSYCTVKGWCYVGTGKPRLKLPIHHLGGAVKILAGDLIAYLDRLSELRTAAADRRRAARLAKQAGEVAE